MWLRGFPAIVQLTRKLPSLAELINIIYSQQNDHKQLNVTNHLPVNKVMSSRQAARVCRKGTENRYDRCFPRVLSHYGCQHQAQTKLYSCVKVGQFSQVSSQETQWHVTSFVFYGPANTLTKGKEANPFKNWWLIEFPLFCCQAGRLTIGTFTVICQVLGGTV